MASDCNLKRQLTAVMQNAAFDRNRPKAHKEGKRFQSHIIELSHHISGDSIS